MPHSIEAQFAEAHPQEFLVGISIGSRVMQAFPGAKRDILKDELRDEIAEWGIANSPDVTSPFIISQETAVRLGAESEIELRTGVKI